MKRNCSSSLSHVLEWETFPSLQRYYSSLGFSVFIYKTFHTSTEAFSAHLYQLLTFTDKVSKTGGNIPLVQYVFHAFHVSHAHSYLIFLLWPHRLSLLVCPSNQEYNQAWGTSALPVSVTNDNYNSTCPSPAPFGKGYKTMWLYFRLKRKYILNRKVTLQNASLAKFFLY